MHSLDLESQFYQDIDELSEGLVAEVAAVAAVAVEVAALVAEAEIVVMLKLVFSEALEEAAPFQA